MGHCRYLLWAIAGLQIVLGGTLLCGQAMADGKQVTFQGRIVHIVQCTVNDDKPVEVSFGNVNVTTVTAGRHKVPLPDKLKCTGVGSGNVVTMVLNTTRRGTHDLSGMGTGITGLDIRLLKNGAPQAVGAPFVVDPDSPPVLELELELDPAVASPALEDFEATGTLTSEYQ
ncbi:fimbrial protein [Cedecea sp. NFIX57]|uniref:fimbrial protein n=1 Tax=Cedecea sp. NFIX57 TaxID=1566286 RepID=UPI000A09845A|nr:fimbrial protein [Cedecea sp. NFIX57]SMG61780.1 Pilin (type 1 fimbria component protein) [Cedecea sp. NFIX57]